MAAKRASATKSAAKSAPGAKLDGDALVRSVLAGAGITLTAANKASPGVSMAKFLLEGEQAATAYGKSRAVFAKVPSFDVSLARAASALVSHAKSADSAWSAARFVRAKGEGRELTRKDAEAHRSQVIRTARFLFRNDRKAHAEIDRIAQGEGLPDLIRDHEELAALAKNHAALFAQATKLGDVVAKCTAFAEALKHKRDDTGAQALHEARNRAVVALDVSLGEIRAAARFLYEGNAAAIAPYLTTRPRRTK